MWKSLWVRDGLKASHCLWVIAWTALWEKPKELVDREKQEAREDTAWPVDLIRLRPSLLCGHAGRISMSNLGLILVSLERLSLLRISTFVHLLSFCWLQRKRHKTVVWWHQSSSKLCAAFSNLRFGLSNWGRVRDLGAENPGSVPHTLLYSTKIGSWIHSAELVSTSESWMRIFFFFLSQIVESIVIPAPFFISEQPPKSRHCQWINEDVLCSLQWDTDLKYLHYHTARLLRGSSKILGATVKLEFVKENGEVSIMKK